MQALEPDPKGPPVLLIDELDRTDEPFEAFLLELLSDFQVTIPEIGAVKAVAKPIVVITSNRTREIHDALKRRCFYYWVDYPDSERELTILRTKVPAAGLDLSKEVVAFVQKLRKRDLFKLPGVAETIDWTDALVQLDQVALNSGAIDSSLGALLKYQDDIARIPRHRGRRDPGTGARRSRRRKGGQAAAALMAGEMNPGRSRLAQNILLFARTLRAAGLPIGPGKVIDAIEAVKAAGIGSRDDFYWTLHAVFVQRREQREIFDQAFHIFWKNPQFLQRMMSLLLPQFRYDKPEEDREEIATRLAEALQGDRAGSFDDMPIDEEQVEIDAAMTFSDRELLQEMDFREDDHRGAGRDQEGDREPAPADHGGADPALRCGFPRPPRRHARDPARQPAQCRRHPAQIEVAEVPASAAGDPLRHFGLDEPLFAHGFAFRACDHQRPATGCIPSCSGPGSPTSPGTSGTATSMLRWTGSDPM